MVKSVTVLGLFGYDAQDGFRITIFGPVDCDFRDLLGTFAELSVRDVDIWANELPYVEALGGARVLMSSRASARWHDYRRGPGIIGKCGGPDPVFEWRGTPDDWECLAELIEPLTRGHRPAHQYLGLYAHDDAVIVLSKGEYNLETVRATIQAELGDRQARDERA